MILDQIEKLPMENPHRQTAAVMVKYLMLLVKLYNMKSTDLKNKGER